jgi:hypothetical protein
MGRKMVNNAFIDERNISEALGIVWGFGSINEKSLLIRHRDKDLIERFCSLVNHTGQILEFETSKGKAQWAVAINRISEFVGEIESYGFRNIAHLDERTMPQGDYDKATFLYTYAQLHYIHDTVQDRGYERQRIRFNGSTVILECLSRFLCEELGCTVKKIQNHKSSDKMKLLYYQSKKEIPKVLQWLNEPLSTQARESAV